MLARYTPEEARALESHYIACAQREGIWGMGKPPISSSEWQKARDAGTAVGRARREGMMKRQMVALKAVRGGVQTAEEIAQIIKVTPNCARRYLRNLWEAGLIEPRDEVINGLKVRWRAIDSFHLAA